MVAASLATMTCGSAPNRWAYHPSIMVSQEINILFSFIIFGVYYE